MGDKTIPDSAEPRLESFYPPWVAGIDLPRLMGDKTIPDSAEPRLESFYPPFVAGIDLPHPGVVDSYSLIPTIYC